MGSSRRSNEELNESMAAAGDLPERFPSDEKKERKKGKAKKKRLYRLPREDAEMMLSYKCQPLPEILDELAEKEDHYAELVGARVLGDLRAALSAAQDIMKYYEKIILVGQEKIRHDLETKGFITYEATDEIANEDEAAAPAA